MTIVINAEIFNRYYIDTHDVICILEHL